MYVPQHFAMSDEQVRELLATADVGDLISVGPQGLVATLLPFVFDPDAGPIGSLITHVARNNRQWSDPVSGEVMVILHGGDHYISPRWMPSFAQTHQVVPTWNYLTVHAYGHLVAHDDPAWTEDAVRRLTARHETRYSVDQVDPDYVARMLRAIVGVEVQLTRVEAKAKMSQNKSPADVAGIIEGLRTEAGTEAALRSADWTEAHSLPYATARAATLDEVGRSHGR